MAEIICCGCGNIFGSHTLACSYCKRCPRCGTKIKEPLNQCPSCEHPGDALAVSELEDTLDPSLPQDQKLIRWGERERDFEKLEKRLDWVKVLPACLIIAAVITFAVIGLQMALGFDDRWVDRLMFWSHPIAYLVFLGLLRRGWFHWFLLREYPPEESMPVAARSVIATRSRCLLRQQRTTRNNAEDGGALQRQSNERRADCASGKFTMMSIEVLRTEQSWIQKTSGKCGGRACVRTTRIPVWSLVVARRQGASDHELLNYFVTHLTAADIQTAWTYYEKYPEEIEADIQQNDDA